jgi:hypothetical protein
MERIARQSDWHSEICPMTFPEEKTDFAKAQWIGFGRLIDASSSSKCEIDLLARLATIKQWADSFLITRRMPAIIAELVWIPGSRQTGHHRQ